MIVGNIKIDFPSKYNVHQ